MYKGKEHIVKKCRTYFEKGVHYDCLDLIQFFFSDKELGPLAKNINNEVILQKARLNRLRKEKAIGIVNDDQHNKDIQQISVAIYTIICDFEKLDTDEYVLVFDHEHHVPTGYDTPFISVAIVAFFALSFLVTIHALFINVSINIFIGLSGCFASIFLHIRTKIHDNLLYKYKKGLYEIK